MPVGQYPFIDIAVHGEIRGHFARGDLLVLFTVDLSGVLWANGAGARLFGFDSLYEFMDEGAAGRHAAWRQLRAAASRLDGDGDERETAFRVTTGFRSRLLTVSLKRIRLADGTAAIRLVSEASAEILDLHDRAQRIIAGLGGGTTHVAVFDGQGACLAASDNFASLGIADGTLQRLVTDAACQSARLAKRMIPTAGRSVPAAMACLSDEPPLNLLFAIETETETSAAHDAGTAAAHDAGTAAGLSGQEALEAAPWTDDSDDGEIAAMGGDEPETPAFEPPAAEAEPHRTDGAEGAIGAPDGDEFVFEPSARSVRFVWKIDADERFSEISPDFAATVGPNAASVVGRRFDDVANVFAFDRDHRIADLLRRRDTWSGKTVRWPVQGTGLSVPVDLAALPTYSREREFSGFRGFGVVRVGDAAEDPERLGLSLIGNDAVSLAARDDDSGVPEMEFPRSENATAGSTAGDVSGEDDPADTPAPGGETKEDDAGRQAVSKTSDPFRGETPALKIVRSPGRRASDKVIDLEEHRPRQREVLSSNEQAAFREIGKRLADTFGRRDGDTGEPSSEAAPQTPVEPGPGEAETHDADIAQTPSEAEAGDSTGSDGGRMPRTDDGTTDDGPAEKVLAAETTDRSRVAALPSAFASGGQGGRRALDETVVDDLPVALLVHDGDTVHHANTEFLALTGYSGLAALDDAGGLAGLFATPDGDGDGEEGMPAVPGTLQLVRADGSETPVRARLQSVLWKEARALMLSLVAQDSRMPPPAALSDEPETADTALAAYKVEVEELRSILETATDGVVILGEHGDIRSMNRSASALFDYEEDETRGQPFAKLFAHESQRTVMDYLSSLGEHGVASVLNDGREVIGREASGGFLPLFMTIGRLSGSNGYCAVMRDITQWKRTEEDLRAAKSAAEQASSHKSAFLARVSHEIRTPLNAIIGFSDMMAEERFGPIGSARYLEYAHDIGLSGKHVLDIVNDLLDISKIEAGEMEIEFAAVGLNDAVGEAVSLLQPQANSQRVIIRTSLSQSVPEIVADLRSIKQIALNLLANAIRFTPAGGQIVVSSAYETNGSVVLRIRDTGVGMSRAELDQAMKPFRQVKGTSRRSGEGTGLGLPLTKAMVEANRAQFDIRSTPQEGTLIEITFPPQRVLAD